MDVKRGLKDEIQKESPDVEETIEKYEPEFRFRKLTDRASKIVLFFCLILSSFHIYTAGFGVLQEWKHRSFHLTFVLLLIYLVYPIRKKEVARIRSLTYSGIYSFIAGGLISIGLSEVLHLSLSYYIISFLLTGVFVFYFKERTWISERLIPPIDLTVSLIFLYFMVSLISFSISHLEEVLDKSGTPLIIWGVGIIGSITLVFLLQAIYSARCFLLGTKEFKLDPLKIPYFDIVFAIMAAGMSSYIFLDYDQFVLRAGIPNLRDLFIAVFAIPLVLEGTRRSIGVPLTIIALLSVIYCYIGPWLVDIPILSAFAHRGYSIERIIDHMYTGTEGIYGIPVGVVATYVFHFVLFGLFIAKTGLGQLFIDLAMAVAGGTAGGPAKVSVISSGFLGSISGSSIANTVTTGSFTIPLMKRVGYSSNFAGAVEASASTGGQIMPPIMGAAAFIMAEFLGIPYIKIAFAAILPALFHFYAIGVMVHFEALKRGMLGLPREKLPKVLVLLKERGIMLIPLFIITYLLISGRSPFLAAFWSIIIAVSLGQVSTRMMIFSLAVFFSIPSIAFDFNPFEALSLFSLSWGTLLLIGLGITYRRSNRLDWAVGLIPIIVLAVLLATKQKPFIAAFWSNIVVILLGLFYKESRMRVPQIIEAMELGTKNALAVGAACASVGFIIGTTVLTGLGLRFGYLTVNFASNTADFLSNFDIWHLFTIDAVTLFFILVYVAIACFILGMGLPTTAQYIIAAIIAAPALLEFGVAPLISHMFVFFYAVLADVTPPVALASYAAAGISGGDPLKTGFISFSLSSAKYLVPFMFIYSPIILFLPWLLDPEASFNFLEFGFLFVSITLGVTALGAGMRGYLANLSTLPERALCFFAAFLLFHSGVATSLAGGALFLAIYLTQKARRKRRALLVE